MGIVINGDTEMRTSTDLTCSILDVLVTTDPVLRNVKTRPIKIKRT
jgi:hypothetical protein